MKKVKLFTTIASLCLAVALMAFGVYAATSVTATVNGSISFVATDVNVSLVSIEWYAENVADGGSVSAKKTLTAGGNGEYTIPELTVTSLDAEAVIHIFCTVKNDSNQNEARLNATITADDEQFITKTNPQEVKIATQDSNTIEAVIGFKVEDKTTTPTSAYTFKVVFDAQK